MTDELFAKFMATLDRAQEIISEDADRLATKGLHESATSLYGKAAGLRLALSFARDCQ